MLAAAVLLAEYAVTLDLLDTTALRARTSLQLSAPSGTATGGLFGGLDLSTAPSAALRVADRRWSYTLSYTPTLTASDLQDGLTLQLFQFASASIAWHDRSTSIVLFEGASYGQINAAYLNQTPTVAGPPATTQTVPTIQAVPTTQTIQFGTSNTDLSVGQAVGRHVHLLFSGGYTFSGGLDETSRRYVPDQSGPHAGASAGYDFTRRDRLTTSLAANEVTTSGQCPPPAALGMSCTEHAYIAQLLEAYLRRLSAVATLSLGAGVAVAHFDGAGTEQTTTYPSASIAFGDRFGEHGRYQLTLTAALAPVADPRTGMVSNRAQENATLTDSMTSVVTLRYTVGATESVPFPASDPYPLTIFTESVDASFRVDRRVSISVGEQTLWQDQAGYGTLVSGFVYVALTVRAPTVRF